MTESEMKNIPFPGHCIEYINAIKDGIIIEINDGDGLYIENNLSDKASAAYLNKDGLVIIGEYICFSKSNVVKFFKKDDINHDIKELKNINSDLRSITSDLDYYVYATSEWVYSGSKNRARVDVKSRLRPIGVLYAGQNYGKQIAGDPLEIRTNAQKRNFWGNWNQYWGEEYIIGECTTTLHWDQVCNGPYHGSWNNNSWLKTFHINEHFPSASNAVIKYDIFTGERNALLDFSFITAPNNGFYSWPSNAISFQIFTKLPGGASGITCTARSHM